MLAWIPLIAIKLPRRHTLGLEIPVERQAEYDPTRPVAQRCHAAEHAEKAVGIREGLHRYPLVVAY